MKVLLAGPIETAALGEATNVDLSDLPPATTQTPIGPLAAGLLQAGHEVHVVTTDPTIEHNLFYSRGPLTLTYCPVRAAPRYRARVRARDLFAKEISHLKAAMLASDADIIHSHWTYEFAEAAIRTRRPMIVTMHDLGWDSLRSYRDLYRFMRLLMKYRSMFRIKTLTTVSPKLAHKAWIYGYFGPVAVIPNPIELAPLYAKCLAKPIIVTVGNAGRSKNVVASVTAFKKIREHFSNAELHLFGPGLDTSGIMPELDGVIPHGNVPHGVLMQFLAEKATLLVHPSRVETFGVIVGEAKMRGVPVVAGANTGGVDYVINGAGGVLVDVEDPEAIATASIRILGDPFGYMCLQKEAHEDAASRFSLPKVTAEYVAAYQRVLGNNR